MAKNPYLEAIRGGVKQDDVPAMSEMIKEYIASLTQQISSLQSEVLRLTQSCAECKAGEARAMGELAARDARIIGLERVNAESARRADEAFSRAAEAQGKADEMAARASKAEVLAASLQGRLDGMAMSESEDDGEEDKPETKRGAITYVVNRDAVGEILSIVAKPEA